MIGCVLALSFRIVDSAVAETRAAHARFLIQATFGPTRDTIDELDGPYAGDYGAWIRDVRFGRGGTASFESLRSKFCQNSVRNHQNSARILSEFIHAAEFIHSASFRW